MERLLQKNKMKKTKGFTLVEVIVVLVILAILAAILIPSFIQYIDKANKKASIAECRQVVLAAQGIAVELYTSGDLTALNEAKTHSQILALAEVKGEILEDIETDEQQEGKISWLRYKCENGVIVLYDITQDPPYIVEGDSAYLTALQKWVQQADKLTAEYGETALNNALGRENVIKYIEDHGGLKKVDDRIKENSKFSGEDLYWRPYYLGDIKASNSILFANTGNSGHSGWKAKLVYVNGTVYQSTGQDSSISQIYTNKNYEDTEKWLLKNGFEKMK